MLKLSLRALVMGLIATGISGVAAAAQPTTGLGESWPNATDVSLNPHYHVYVFKRNGIRYIQVNELDGTIDAAVATANGTVLTLPIGQTADQVQILQLAQRRAPEATPANTAIVVYRDATTTVSAIPLSNGTSQVVLLAPCTDPDHCSG